MGAAELAQRISRGFFSTTPVVLQTEAAECGLACLAMVAAHHGHRTNLPALRQRFTTSLKGLTIRDLVRLGADLKLATRALRLDLVDLKQLRLPCILHWDHNHFVVLTRVSTTKVVLHDPAIGRRTMRLEEFSRHFTGVALEAWPADGFQPRNERARIHVADFVRHARGIGWAAIQILAISLLLEAATIAMPIGFQLALDEVVVAADYDLLTIIVLALGLLLVLQVITGLVRAWVTLLIGSSLVLQWKASLFDQLMRLPLAFFEKRHVGDVVSRFNSLDAVQRTLTASSIQALLDGVMSILLIFMMGLYGGYLLVIALATARTTRPCGGSVVVCGGMLRCVMGSSRSRGFVGCQQLHTQPAGDWGRTSRRRFRTGSWTGRLLHAEMHAEAGVPAQRRPVETDPSNLMRLRPP